MVCSQMSQLQCSSLSPSNVHPPDRPYLLKSPQHFRAAPVGLKYISLLGEHFPSLVHKQARRNKAVSSVSQEFLLQFPPPGPGSDFSQ